MQGRESGRLTSSRLGLRAFIWAQGMRHLFWTANTFLILFMFLIAFEFLQGKWANKISWNRNLSRARAVGMGGEFRTKGANVFLGPVVSPLGRTVTSGRNWEGTWLFHLCSSLLLLTFVRS